MEATCVSFITAYDDGWTQKDPSLINRAVAASCTRHIRPRSASTIGLPIDLAIDNELYEQLYAKDLAVSRVKNSKMENLVLDIQARKASFMSTSDVEFVDGGDMVLEFVWFLEFNEDGTQITKVVEVVDTGTLPKFIAKIDELSAKTGAESS